MPLYVSAEALAKAVRRLSTSNAKPSLCDFLIVKHAMAAGDGTVTLSLGDKTYMRSVRALAAVTPNPDEDDLPPFFNPFGTSREGKQGWRSRKYPSNGPPDTVNGPGWKGVIEVLSEKPRRIRLAAGYLDHLPRVIATSEGPPPQIEDCALWLYRDTDLETVLAPTANPTLADLTEAFVDETDLSQQERVAIFGAP